MNWLQWWGVIIVACAILGLCRAAWNAHREKRFGISHLKSPGFVGAVLALVMGSVFFYGWFKYPDAPIQACAGKLGYCGKQGQPHSFLEYRQFMTWQTTLFVVWPMGMLIAFGLNKWRSKLDTGSAS